MSEQQTTIATESVNEVAINSEAVEVITPQQPEQEVVDEQLVLKKRKKSKIIYHVRQVCLILLAALATAVSVEVFLLPSDTISGGVLGIASILDILLCEGGTHWYFSAGIWVFALNIPIIVGCFFVFRKKFVIKTVIYVVSLSAFLLTLRLLNVSVIAKDLMYGDKDMDKVISILLGGALHGVSLPIMLSANASTGGSDIVGLMVQRHTKKSSSSAMRIIMFTNVCIVLISAVVFYFVKRHTPAFEGNATQIAVNMFIYSIAAMFICEIVQELIFKGFSAALELEVTTDKPKEMAEALQAGLRHGTTTIKVVGGYTKQERTMILCVINKQQLTKARKIINKVDDKAFAYVENVKEVLGKGFANKEISLEDEETKSNN